MTSGLLSDGGSITLAGLIDVDLQLHEEVLPPQVGVRFDAEKRFIEDDEVRDVQNGLRGKMVKLEAVKCKML